MTENEEGMLDFVEWQLERWPEARGRYVALGNTLRRSVTLGDMVCGIQCNPARVVSTGAAVDKASVAARPCFLCPDNRPDCQKGVPILPGWVMLLNPYPVFPVHFTIAAESHIPQDRIPPEMASLAEELPGLTVFFNGARAGASAPDHLHLQAVRTEELPLMSLAAGLHPVGRPGAEWSDSWGPDLPFRFLSAVITPDGNGMRTLAHVLGTTGTDPATGLPDPGLVNAFFWIDNPSGLLRAVIVPRRAHRPSCYGTMPGQCLVSPGAIDMAGIIITPRREDYDSLTDADVRRIYTEVACPPKPLK